MSDLNPILKHLKPCPVCKAKAFLNHDVVDGFDMGYSVGCPRYCIGDGIHGINEEDAYSERHYSMHGFFTKEAAAMWWNRRAE